MARARELCPRHSAYVEEFNTSGDLLLIGTFADPAEDGSMAIFRSREAAERFVANDSFIVEGVVVRWRILDWNGEPSAQAYDAHMSDGFDDDQDRSDAQREAVVEMANLTNGMMGGIFDRSRESSPLHRSSRSTPIGRVRAVSGIAAISLALLAIASPVVLGLTVGVTWSVTIGLGVAAVAAGIVYGVSYAVGRRRNAISSSTTPTNASTSPM
ncbi:MAG TPA: YciI family protein [Pseudolysinimonas sp.]|nr:YciI family protein [Pseudolysinimonas sp.]